MRAVVQLAAQVVLAGLVAGCGGGHWIEEPEPRVTPAPTGNVIRQIQPGDILTATVTGTAVAPAGSGALSGTVTLSTHLDIAPPVFGNRALRVVVEYDITEPAGTTLQVQNDYTEQASTTWERPQRRRTAA